MLAKEEAARLKHDYVGPEHILLGLLREGTGVAVAVIKSLGLSLIKLKKEIENSLTTGTGVVLLEELPFTPKAKKALELAIEEASGMSHNYVGTEHLLLGVIKEGESIASKILESAGVTLERAREISVELLGGPPPKNLLLFLLQARTLPNRRTAQKPRHLPWICSPGILPLLQRTASLILS